MIVLRVLVGRFISIHLSCIQDDSAKSVGRQVCPELLKALDGILFIAQQKKRSEESIKVNRYSKNKS